MSQRIAGTRMPVAIRKTSRSLISVGLGPWASFWRVSLPLARPAIVAGVSKADRRHGGEGALYVALKGETRT